MSNKDIPIFSVFEGEQFSPFNLSAMVPVRKGSFIDYQNVVQINGIEDFLPELPKPEILISLRYRSSPGQLEFNPYIPNNFHQVPALTLEYIRETIEKESDDMRFDFLWQKLSVLLDFQRGLQTKISPGIRTDLINRVMRLRLDLDFPGASFENWFLNMNRSNLAKTSVTSFSDIRCSRELPSKENLQNTKLSLVVPKDKLTEVAARFIIDPPITRTPIPEGILKSFS